MITMTDKIWQNCWLKQKNVHFKAEGSQERTQNTQYQQNCYGKVGSKTKMSDCNELMRNKIVLTHKGLWNCIFCFALKFYIFCVEQNSTTQIWLSS